MSASHVSGFRLGRSRGGVPLTAGLNTRFGPVTPDDPAGMHVRGVVIQVYGVEDSRIEAAHEQVFALSPNTVYADVLVYSGLRGARVGMLSRCLVLQPFGGMHEGMTYIPKATQTDLSTGLSPDFNSVNPGNCDGDHVVCTWLDGSFRLPIIVGYLPHPRLDTGVELRPLGARLASRNEPRTLLTKFAGGYFGFENNGTYVVDTQYSTPDPEAPDGRVPLLREEADVLQSSGDTVPRILDTSGVDGNQVYRLRTGSSFQIEIVEDSNRKTRLVVRDGQVTISTPASSNVCTIQTEAPLDASAAEDAPTANPGTEVNARIVLGDGSRKLAQVEELRALYEELKARFDSHAHEFSNFLADQNTVIPSSTSGPTRVSGGGLDATVLPPPATGPAAAIPLEAPDWDPRIENDRVLVPKTLLDGNGEVAEYDE